MIDLTIDLTWWQFGLIVLGTIVSVGAVLIIAGSLHASKASDRKGG